MIIAVLKNYKLNYRDDDGGVPGSHVTQILGTAQPTISQALAAGVPAFFNEPKTGTMSQVKKNYFFKRF